MGKLQKKMAKNDVNWENKSKAMWQALHQI